jgi:hypothetical protein
LASSMPEEDPGLENDVSTDDCTITRGSEWVSSAEPGSTASTSTSYDLPSITIVSFKNQIYPINRRVLL